MIMHKDGSIEGTPLEIMEYQRLQVAKAKVEREPFQWRYAGTIYGRCPSRDKACYCTGACMGLTTSIDSDVAKL